jgi:hypothetical protein
LDRSRPGSPAPVPGTPGPVPVSPGPVPGILGPVPGTPGPRSLYISGRSCRGIPGPAPGIPGTVKDIFRIAGASITKHAAYAIPPYNYLYIYIYIELYIAPASARGELLQRKIAPRARVHAEYIYIYIYIYRPGRAGPRAGRQAPASNQVSKLARLSVKPSVKSCMIYIYI